MAINNLKSVNINAIIDYIKNIGTRFYHPNLSVKIFIKNAVDYVGNKNAAMGAALFPVLVFLISLSIFTIIFSIVFYILLTIISFIVVKLIFYKPTEITPQENNKNNISFMKNIRLNGASEITVYTQSDLKDKHKTYALFCMYDFFSIINCKNITSITDLSYRSVLIKFYHPIGNNYNIHVITQKEQPAKFKISKQTDAECRIDFMLPIPKLVRVNMTIPST